MTITKAIQIRNILTRLIGLLFGSMVYSAGLNLFLVPNSIIDGGVVGISLILAELTKISFSVWIILLNAPFFYIGFRRLGLNMALSSSFAVMVLSLWSKIFEGMDPITKDPFLGTIFGGVIIGIGVGIVIRSGGSLDGTEIMAILLDSKTSFSVGEIVLFFNLFILGSAGFVFSWNSAMYSLVAYFICSRLIDTVSDGLDSTKGVFIVTSNYDEVSNAIVHDMRKAVTLLHGQGGFLREDKDILYCVVSRLEVTKLKQVVQSIDPQAFLSIFDVQEVEGGRIGKKK